MIIYSVNCLIVARSASETVFTPISMQVRDRDTETTEDSESFAGILSASHQPSVISVGSVPGCIMMPLFQLDIVINIRKKCILDCRQYY